MRRAPRRRLRFDHGGHTPLSTPLQPPQAHSKADGTGLPHPKPYIPVHQHPTRGSLRRNIPIQPDTSRPGPVRQTPPKNPFILITRDDIPQAVRLSDKKFLAFNRIIHKHFILSHLFDGRCKQHGAGLEHPRLRLRAGKALHQIAPQTVRVAIPGQNFGRIRQAKAQRPQGADTSGCTSCAAS